MYCFGWCWFISFTFNWIISVSFENASIVFPVSTASFCKGHFLFSTKSNWQNPWPNWNFPQLRKKMQNQNTLNFHNFWRGERVSEGSLLSSSLRHCACRRCCLWPPIPSRPPASGRPPRRLVRRYSTPTLTHCQIELVASFAGSILSCPGCESNIVANKLGLAGLPPRSSAVDCNYIKMGGHVSIARNSERKKPNEPRERASRREREVALLGRCPQTNLASAAIYSAKSLVKEYPL